MRRMVIRRIQILMTIKVIAIPRASSYLNSRFLGDGTIGYASV